MSPAPNQKPAIPLLNISAQNRTESNDIEDRLGLNLAKLKAPGIKGIALDISQVSRKQNFDDNETSFDKIIEESQEISSSRGSVGNPTKGISLDLTKAKAIQNEILNQSSLPKEKADFGGKCNCSLLSNRFARNK